jgi:hypothetical protein
MQDKQLFEYAIIRMVPRVEREEFLNVGVILYCASMRFLQSTYELNEKRLLAFADDVDQEELKRRLCAFERICSGDERGGPIAKLPLASRFRWLTATRSTMVQTSPVHPGLSMDPNETLVRLHEQLVK